jgi:hypothetical protein
MFAVEPNGEACAFLSKNILNAEVCNVGDDEFVKSTFPNQRVNISLVNSVFYCMKPSRVKSVLEKLANISDVIVIGDSMKNVYNDKSYFNSDPVYYSHPYILWLKALGYINTSIIKVPNGQPQLDGYIIAKKI